MLQRLGILYTYDEFYEAMLQLASTGGDNGDATAGRLNGVRFATLNLRNDELVT